MVSSYPSVRLFAVRHDSLGQEALLCVLLVVIGLAMVMSMPAMIAEIGILVVDEEKQNDDETASQAIFMATG
jgi:hypothetical protein